MQHDLPSIAIIDDDDIYQMLIKSILGKKLPNPILQFFSGFQALSFYKLNLNNCTVLPSVCFLDLTMPGMSGWQFLDELDTLSFNFEYHPSIYILTGSSQVDFEKLRDYPLIKGVLIKPVPPDKFLSIIQEAIMADTHPA